MESRTRLSEQVILLVIGAIIGFLPATIQIQLQARAQRQEFLFEQRLEALRSFATAANGGGQLFAKDEALELLMTEMSTMARPENQLQKLQTMLGERTVLLNQYVANLHTEAAVMSAVFGVRIPVEKYADIDFKGHISHKGESRKQSRADLQKDVVELQREIQTQHHLMIQLIENYESELDRIASLLSP